MAEAAVQESVAEPRTARGTIDCDVHPYFRNGLHDLMPYMSKTWAHRLGIGGDLTWSSSFAASEFVLPQDNLYINAAGATRGDSSPNGAIPGSDPDFMIEQLIDPNGIERVILLHGQMGGLGTFPDADVASTVASAHNEWIQENWFAHDPRFRGGIVVAPQDPAVAAREIDRCADKHGFVGVYLPLHKIAMGERHFHPIYEAAQRNGLPIINHPAGTENVFATAPGMALTPTYYLEWHSALGQVHQSNVLSLLCNGVFERFPELKVVIAEGGFIWAIESMLKLDRDWQGLRNEVPWVKRPPSEYLREHVWFTTQPFVEPHKREHLAPLLDMIYAEDTFLFSSDYPHWDFDNPKAALNAVDRELRERICTVNPHTVYGERLG